MVVLPVGLNATLCHEFYKLLSACGLLSAVHDRHSNVLNIAFDFLTLRFLQELIGFFGVGRGFFSVLALKGFTFLTDMQSSLAAYLIRKVFHLLKL